MHPLSVFPQLFFLQFFAPFLLRLTVGFFLMYLGKERKEKEYGWAASLYAICGLLMIMGFYTQIAVIVGMALLWLDFYSDKKSVVSNEKYFLFVITEIVLLSLLFTGPGLFALDLPL